jgi:hypothetical protein
VAENTISDNEENTETQVSLEAPDTNSDVQEHVDKKSTVQESPDSILDETTFVKKVWGFRNKDTEFSRDEWILSHIDNSQLMEYLRLEQTRSEFLQEVRDTREKRILKAVELTLALSATVAVVFLLKDEPSILINILYIVGIVTAFWFWKNPRDK